MRQSMRSHGLCSAVCLVSPLLAFLLLVKTRSKFDFVDLTRPLNMHELRELDRHRLNLFWLCRLSLRPNVLPQVREVRLCRVRTPFANTYTAAALTAKTAKLSWLRVMLHGHSLLIVSLHHAISTRTHLQVQSRGGFCLTTHLPLLSAPLLVYRHLRCTAHGLSQHKLQQLFPLLIRRHYRTVAPLIYNLPQPHLQTITLNLAGHARAHVCLADHKLVQLL